MASSKNKKDKKPKSKKMKGNILEEIKDVYYKDLPESLQKDLMEIHKIIVQGCHDEWQKSYYDDIRNSAWAKSMYDEFCEMPMGKQNTGSARLYKKKNRYSCMIQITGHVPNNREDIQHEEFHEFIRAVHINLKAKIRRKFDMALVCESEHGEHFEGFDVWPKQKVAKMLWEKYPDVRIIEDKPHKDKEVTESAHTYSMDVECLPYGLQEKVFAYNEFIRHNIISNASDELLNEDGFVKFMYSTDLTDDDIGYTEVTESIESNGKIYLTGPLYLNGVKEYKEEVTELIKDTCNQLNYLMDDSTKKVIFENNQFVLELQPEYADKVIEYSMVESIESQTKKNDKPDHDEKKNHLLELKNSDYKSESTDDEYFYKEDVNDTEETNPKATIASLADMVMKNEKNISQASASTFATVITANFLKDWAPGYNKFNLYVGNYKKGNELEFKLPTMNKEFISRFIQGRESIDGFLHQNPEITVKMDSRVFTTMKNKTDAYRFFKSLIKYYVNAIPKFANKLQSAVSTMNRKTKFVISNSTLNGLIAIPFRMLTAFDNVDMSSKNYFHLKNSEVDAVCKFILNVAENYNNKTDKKENIIKDLKGVISSFNESTSYDQNLVSIRRSIDTYINGVDSVVMEEWNDHNAIWMDEQVDINETYHNEDGEIAYLQEAHKVKKLKKIPRDLIAYITIETESIEDANDKMMIASYCLGKLDIVEWYIELIDTANPKYIVPHTRPYLVTLRTQLLECYKNIMATKIPDKKKRPYLDIDYPAGFEG